MPFPILPSNSATGYFLTKSLRFRASVSAYLNRTFGTPTDNKKFTWSGWVKRGTLGAFQVLQCGDDGTSDNFLSFRFSDTDTLQCFQIGGGSYNLQVSTSAVFRDPSAWYHIVFVYDSANATSTNRIQFYVNGVSQAVSYAVGPFAINTASQLNVASRQNAIGRLLYASVQYFDGYLAEVNFIDGQALTPSSFGSTNALTGVWQPAKYTGTYGTNGFYLPFTNTTSTSTLGNDFSGNSNNWTTNNFSLTTGTTYDSMTDVPTLTSATTANYCVWNPLDDYAVTVTNGNLTIFPTVDTGSIRGTMGLPLTGKFYWETTVNSLGYGSGLGIASASSILSASASSAQTRTYQWGSWFNSFNGGVVQYGTNQGITSGANWSSASQLAANDVVMIAVDMDNGSMWVGKNGTWFNSSGTANPATNTDPRWTGLGGTTWFPYFNGYNFSGVTSNTNFGQRPFAYTPPTGFVALNTFNLPTSTIVKGNTVMNVNLYTGNGTGQTISGVNFQPDLTWVKSRNATYSHALVNSVVGTGNFLRSNRTDANTTYDPATQDLKSFNSDGFVLGTTFHDVFNANGVTYVSWNWKANGTGVTNTDGSITSTVSANPTAGFSVVTFTSDGTTAGGTVGHGLGVAPSMVIYKGRNTVENWFTYHVSLGGSNAVFLNLINASTATGTFNSTTPTSSVIQLRQSSWGASNLVAYCWAEIAGYSKFGSFTGNGLVDGPFVYLGFRPAFFMVKRTDGPGSDWFMLDDQRPTFNVIGAGNGGQLAANQSYAESTLSSYPIADFLSNGIKVRGDMNVGYWTASGGTYIYMAFAENPFKNALAR